MDYFRDTEFIFRRLADAAAFVDGSKKYPDIQGRVLFYQMKDGVIVINTSRGGLIDEQALKDALDSGKVSFAAVDVVSEEPIKPDNPLLRADNCIITPHIAWASKESRKRLMDTAVMNLVSYLDGEPINVVNFR